MRHLAETFLKRCLQKKEKYKVRNIIQKRVGLVALATAVGLIISGCTTGTSSPETSSQPTAASGEEIVLELSRFFGDCDDTTEGVTDVKLATTECEVIQIITNAFNAADNGITVQKLGGQAWDDYYLQLSTAIAAGSPPDVAVMHQHRLLDFVDRGLILPLTAPLESRGVDWAGYTAPATASSFADGEYWGVPFDIHASLWHLNVDLFTQAGLVDSNGVPIAPESPEELLEQCRVVQEATGQKYFANEWGRVMTTRLFLSLVWQQGSDIVTPDGEIVFGPEAAEALSLLNTVAAECSNVGYDYAGAQSAFLAGEAAVLHNGTWVVDQYVREAPFEYLAGNIPSLYGSFAAWGDSHMWVVPVQPDGDQARYDASLEFVAFLHENIANWALGTGHIATTVSAVGSSDYQSAPQRANYALTAETARLVPSVPGWPAAWAALSEELVGTWTSGVDQATALSNASARMNESLRDAK